MVVIYFFAASCSRKQTDFYEVIYFAIFVLLWPCISWCLKHRVICWPSSMKLIFKNTCVDLYHDPFNLFVNLFVNFIRWSCHWIVQMDLFVLLFRQDVSKLIDWNEYCYYEYVFTSNLWMKYLYRDNYIKEHLFLIFQMEDP